MMLFSTRMWKHLLSAPAAALGLLLSAAVCCGQSAPPNLPSQTVYGRLGIVGQPPGPGQAIPFAILLAQLSAATGSNVGFITVPGVGLIPVATPSAATLYASPTGSDLNNYCFNSGTPCTLKGACIARVKVATYFVSEVNISLADGTYSAVDSNNALCTVVGDNGGNATTITAIVGDCATPTNVILSIPANDVGFYIKDLGIASISCLEMTGGNGSIGIENSGQGAVSDYDKVTWGAWGTAGIHVSIAGGGFVNLGADGEIVAGNFTSSFHIVTVGAASYFAGGQTNIPSAVSWTGGNWISAGTATGAQINLTNWSVTGAGVAGSTGAQATFQGPGMLTTAASASCTSVLPGSGGCSLLNGFQDSANDPQGQAYNLQAASVTNAKLANPATTVNGQTCTLGSTCTITTGSGASIYLCTITASNSAVMSYASPSAGTCTLNSTYTSYTLVFQNVVPASNEKILELEIHSGGSFKTSGYLSNWLGYVNGSGVNGAPTTYVPLSYPTDTNAASLANAAPGYSGTVTITTPSASGISWVNAQFTYIDGNSQVLGGFGSGFWNTAAVVDGFEVLMDSGNITSGAIQVYGNQ